MGSRRGQGEGSIYQRTDGRWCASVDLGWVNGKRKRKDLYGKTRKEVAEKLKIILRDVQQGTPVVDDRQTVEQFLQHWLDAIIVEKVRPKTLHSYREIARLHIIPDLGKKPLTKLTAQHVQSLLSQKRQSGLSARTVAYIRSVLVMALKQAMKWDLVTRNVAELVSAPREDTKELTVLTQQQSTQLFEAARGNRFEALYMTALLLGLRRGEVLGLEWQHVDFDQRLIHIRKSITLIRGTTSISELKTKSSRRTLPLPEVLIEPLHKQKERQDLEKQTAGPEWNEHGLVFTTRYGTPINPSNLLKWFQKLLNEADLPHIRFHDLRHSCASLLAAQGVPARVAMDILGHSDIRITQNIYTHVFDESKREVAGVMDSVFGNKPDV